MTPEAKKAFEEWNLTEDPFAEASEAQCFAAGYAAATAKLREELASKEELHHAALRVLQTHHEREAAKLREALEISDKPTTKGK